VRGRLDVVRMRDYLRCKNLSTLTGSFSRFKILRKTLLPANHYPKRNTCLRQVKFLARPQTGVRHPLYPEHDS
jgi:hypothetical protein